MNDIIFEQAIETLEEIITNGISLEMIELKSGVLPTLNELDFIDGEVTQVFDEVLNAMVKTGDPFLNPAYVAMNHRILTWYDNNIERLILSVNATPLNPMDQIIEQFQEAAKEALVAYRAQLPSHGKDDASCPFLWMEVMPAKYSAEEIATMLKDCVKNLSEYTKKSLWYHYSGEMIAGMKQMSIDEDLAIELLIRTHVQKWFAYTFCYDYNN